MLLTSEQTEVWAKQPQIGETHTENAKQQTQTPSALRSGERLWHPPNSAQTHYYYPTPQQKPNPGTEAFLGIGADLWVAIFTFCLVVATVIQAILILRAERLTRAALKQSIRQGVQAKITSKRQAEDTKISLEIAQKAAAAAQQQALAAVGAELPILHIIKFSTDNERAEDRNTWIRNLMPDAQIKNFGRTTAVVTDLILNVGFGMCPMTPPPLKRHNDYPTAFPIEPQCTYTFTDFFLKESITEEDITGWLADTGQNFYIFGRIFYRDFLGAHEQGFLFIWVEENRSFSSFEQRTAFYVKT